MSQTLSPGLIRGEPGAFCPQKPRAWQDVRVQMAHHAAFCRGLAWRRMQENGPVASRRAFLHRLRGLRGNGSGEWQRMARDGFREPGLQGARVSESPGPMAGIFMVPRGAPWGVRAFLPGLLDLGRLAMGPVVEAAPLSLRMHRGSVERSDIGEILKVWGDRNFTQDAKM